jgi:ABC-type antimicrobial peptide transport system permease subunit
MGRLFLVARLAAADMRRYPVEAALLLLAITAATATLSLGLALRGATDNPYQRTRSATHGPDVVAGLVNLAPPPRTGRLGPGPGHETLYSNDEQPSKKRTADFDSLTHAAGVVAKSGPYPVAWATLKWGAKSAGVAVEGRDTRRAAIDQPLVSEGHWISGRDTAVVEASYAQALGIHVGEQISLDGKHFTVVGLAVTAAVPNYPNVQTALGGSPFPDPGLIWVPRASAKKLATASLPLSYLLNLNLQPTVKATTFVAAHSKMLVSLLAAAQIGQQDAKLIEVERTALTFGSWLLSLLAIASVAVLVGGRMAEQERRVGLLKAVGATPGFVAVVLLVEHLTLAFGAAATGLLIGWLAAPLLTGPGAGLLGSAGSSSITVSSALLILAVAFGVAILATLVPTLRASRLSTMRALADQSRPPRRSTRLIRLSSCLPVPLLLGLRLAVRRPRRALLAAFSVAVTVTTVVAVVTVHAHQELMSVAGFSSIDNPRTDRINHSLLLVSIILLALAAINALFITWSTAIDARQPLTISRALGATPRQVTLGLSAAQVISALPGAVIGLPAGLALVAALSHGDTTTVPALWLVVVFVGTLLAVAALSSIPASLSAQRSVAEVLRADMA